ncbi:hypothetical protein Y032_0001g447 [Ancylostoma ceylanicum]|uniref:Uncharacterized protein n=1 Tax=Ancylostoma ceylanicum TaxID=53326 RepID=A0A016W660_9BILA|nr:hypothetical protein Y032_0001g447 [Ancylostoma ceylanicum]
MVMRGVDNCFCIYNTSSMYTEFQTAVCEGRIPRGAARHLNSLLCQKQTTRVSMHSPCVFAKESRVAVPPLPHGRLEFPVCRLWSGNGDEGEKEMVDAMEVGFQVVVGGRGAQVPGAPVY